MLHLLRDMGLLLPGGDGATVLRRKPRRALSACLRASSIVAETGELRNSRITRRTQQINTANRINGGVLKQRAPTVPRASSMSILEFILGKVIESYDAIRSAKIWKAGLDADYLPRHIGNSGCIDFVLPCGILLTKFGK
jgi:hypothetical protein